MATFLKKMNKRLSNVTSDQPDMSGLADNKPGHKIHLACALFFTKAISWLPVKPCSLKSILAPDFSAIC